MKAPLRLLPLVLFVLLPVAGAQVAPAASEAQGARLARERAALEQGFAAQRRDCAQRFAVSDCLEAVRQRQAAALAPLLRQEHELAAEDRRSRAAAQRQRVRERELAAAQEDGQRSERLVASPERPAASAPTPHAPRAQSPEQAQRQLAQEQAQAQSNAAERMHRREARESQARLRAKEHAAKLEQGKKPAQPLPLPVPAASTAAAQR